VVTFISALSLKILKVFELIHHIRFVLCYDMLRIGCGGLVMKEKLQLFGLLCCFLVMFCPAASLQAWAATSSPMVCDNMSVGLQSKSALVPTDSGYVRVFYGYNQINVEYLDDAFALQSSKTIEMELEIWGGYYAGEDGYNYIVEGQNNTDEDDTAEVIRVIKYDANWNRIGAATITGRPTTNSVSSGKVRIPFDSAGIDMTELDGKLYIVTGHQAYVDSTYGQGHQGYLMIQVDEETMTGAIVDNDVTHSFAQYIKQDSSGLFVLEQSEGYRCARLSKYEKDSLVEADTLENGYFPQTYDKTSVSIFPYGGTRVSAWAVSCYASVDGMELSADNVLTIGTSIDQSQYENVTNDTSHNLYLTVTPKDGMTKKAATVTWLTDFNGDGKTFLGAKLTKINDNRFLISWEEMDSNQTPSDENDVLSISVLHYLFVDGQGKTVSKEFTAAAPVTDCHPIVKGDKIVYYASNALMVNFYTIDAQTGAFEKKMYRILGNQATWNMSGNTLTISGTGAIKISTTASYRNAVSSVQKITRKLSGGENKWKPIMDKIKKIVIKSGITSIPDQAFASFSSLENVVIENGLESIGEKVFWKCENLKTVTIPDSVTTIGKDILWNGYFWYSDNSHVVTASIIANSGSYAESYAVENGITYSTGKTGSSSNSASGSGETTEKNPSTSVSGTIRTFIGKVGALRVTSPKKKTIKVTWKKVSNATGYQIQYARNAKFTKSLKTITIKNNTTTSKKIANLIKGKKYYVKVRACRKTSKATYSGAWSKSKSVKCK
jgi:hypothetical protein